jgi:hypothetical protein
MIVYNTTIKVNKNIAGEWLQWQQQEHIPEIMATQLFDAYKIFHLLEQDEEEGCTYTTQYFTSSITRYQNYIDQYAPALRAKAFQRWGDGFIAFRSLMEAVY